MAMLDLVAPGDIHSRVSAALSQHLLHIDADQDLPPAIVNDFIQFKNSLHSEPGQLLESMRERSEMELEKVAQKIVILYEKVLTVGAR